MRRFLVAATLGSLLLPSQAFADSWKIGALLCLTGPCASDGTTALHGMQMAADELNAKGGVLGRKVEIKAEDGSDAISGARTVTALQSLRAEGDIHFIVGPSWTPGGLAIAPIVSKDRSLIVATPSLGAAEFHRAGENIFNVRGADEGQTRALARLARKRGLGRVAIFTSDQPWDEMQSNFFADEFKRSGGIVAKEIKIQSAQTEVQNEITLLLAAKPDLLFLTATIQQTIAMKTVRRQHYAGSIYSSYLDDQRVKEAGNELLEGIVAAQIGIPTPEFRAAYASRFKDEPGLPAAMAYDVVAGYARAIEQTKSFEALQVVPVYAAAKFDGASGKFHFDAEGGAVRPISFVQVKAGKLERLAE